MRHAAAVASAVAAAAVAVEAVADAARLGPSILSKVDNHTIVSS